MKTRLRIFRCRRCGGEWASKQTHPRYCGKCKSQYWNKERRSGLITKSRIIRKLKNGTSETTWDGKLKVMTGDKIYLNSVTGEITVKGETK